MTIDAFDGFCGAEFGADLLARWPSYFSQNNEILSVASCKLISNVLSKLQFRLDTFPPKDFCSQAAIFLPSDLDSTSSDKVGVVLDLIERLIKHDARARRR
jgi:hypothetical protein